ncbi:MAG: translesion DNA synthesis-associated protein ImuA [Rubrivivax sp.]|nr:MAG: translesion DNA synthesis-associated protein ImuA [Rubrivivax sp.]
MSEHGLMHLEYCTNKQYHGAMSSPAKAPIVLPDRIAQAMWRGNALGAQTSLAVPSGHAVLDAELPGGGWPCQSLTEILQAPSAHAEWRLLAPGLARLMAQGGTVLLIGPPQCPHLAGLQREGLRPDRLIWIDAQTPAERLWATEQALKARSVSAVLAWLPQARPEQLRRLQACAMQHPGLAFVFRPITARADASAAPLRLQLKLTGPIPRHPPALQIQILKRRGPLLDRIIELAHWPRGLERLMMIPRPPSSGALALG